MEQEWLSARHLGAWPSGIADTTTILVEAEMSHRGAQAECMHVQEKGQEQLVPKLPKNMGWSMGTELRESQYMLSAKNSAPVQRGMIFHVSLGAQPAPLPSLPAAMPSRAQEAAAH